MSKQKYTIIGSGRLALHFSHFFSLQGIDYNSWSRNNAKEFNSHFSIKNSCVRLTKVLKDSDTVLLLISDDQISDFVRNNPELKEKKLIHCSGTLNLTDVYSLHPLMSFSSNLYDPKTYQEVIFVADEKSNLRELIPELPNKFYQIKASQKELYHSLCVITGNFSQLLWAESLHIMKNKLDLPDHVLDLYIKMIGQNFIELKGQSLTGPFARGDEQTIQKNLSSLQGSKLQPIYESFKQQFLPKGENL